MTETVPVYNLVGFIRVIYLRRWFVLIITIVAGAIALGVAVISPEQYRANTNVHVTVPKYKANLTLLPLPNTVSVVRAMLMDADTMREVLEWMEELQLAVSSLASSPNIERVKELLPQDSMLPANADVFTVLASADALPIAKAMLSDDPELLELATSPMRLWSASNHRGQLLALITAMNARELRIVASLNPDSIRAIAPEAMVRRMDAQVTITKETNLETEYSPLIHVSGTAATAAEAEMITNLWLRVFKLRAERLMREQIVNEAAKVMKAAQDIRTRLDGLTNQRLQYLADNHVMDLEAELASKRLALYGVSREETETRSQQGTINVADPEETPYWNDRSSVSQIQRFQPRLDFSQAVLPRLIAARAAESDTAAIQRLADEVDRLKGEITELEQALLGHRRALEVIQIEHSALEAELTKLQPTLNEARLLTSAMETGTVADLSIGTAQQPDRLFSPQRKRMVLAGLAIGLVLACGLCLILDLWGEVVKSPHP